MRALASVLVAFCLALAGCSSVGDFCHSDDECGRGLRCTATGGSRGVCTYPDGVADSAVKGDQKAPDSGGDLPVPDVGVDQAAPDQAAPDQAAPDQAKPDQLTPDAPRPDATMPDATTPDSTKPDATTPDSTKPDAATPDA